MMPSGKQPKAGAASISGGWIRGMAVVYGLFCHGCFLLALASMVVGLYTGMATGLGTLRGGIAWTVNFALTLQFPLLHSLLLSQRGRRLLSRVAPRGLGGALATTSYALVASLQLLATFVAWSPSRTPWWRPEGALLWVLSGLYAASWLLLGKAMVDAGLSYQTGHLGWSSVARGRGPRFGPMPTGGLFRLCRQPIYVAFALTLWTAPVWTPDRLLLATLWTAYCVLGPLHKEERYRRLYGESFRRYQERVPYWWPRLSRPSSPADGQ